MQNKHALTKDLTLHALCTVYFELSFFCENPVIFIEFLPFWFIVKISRFHFNFLTI